MEWKSLGPLLCGSQSDMPFMPAFPNEKHRHRCFILASRGNCFGAGRLRRLRWRLEVASTAAASDGGPSARAGTEDKEEGSKEALKDPPLATIIANLRPASCIPWPISEPSAPKAQQSSGSDCIGRMWEKQRSWQHRGSGSRKLKDLCQRRRSADLFPCEQCQSGAFHAKLDPKLHQMKPRMVADIQSFQCGHPPAIGSISHVLSIALLHLSERTGDR